MADRELDKLARYMVHIAGVDNFQALDHKVRITNDFVLSSMTRPHATLQDWKRVVRALHPPS